MALCYKAFLSHDINNNFENIFCGIERVNNDHEKANNEPERYVSNINDQREQGRRICVETR